MIIKKLTKKQISKADKVIKILEQLSSEGITFYMISTPFLKIGFARTTDNIDMEDFQDFQNTNKNDGVLYFPYNNVRLESYGY